MHELLLFLNFKLCSSFFSFLKRIKAGIFQRSLENLGLNFKKCLKIQIDARRDFSEAFSFVLEEIEVGIEILENHTGFVSVAFKFLQVLRLSC